MNFYEKASENKSEREYNDIERQLLDIVKNLPDHQIKKYGVYTRNPARTVEHDRLETKIICALFRYDQ